MRHVTKLYKTLNLKARKENHNPKILKKFTNARSLKSYQTKAHLVRG